MRALLGALTFVADQRRYASVTPCSDTHTQLSRISSRARGGIFRNCVSHLPSVGTASMNRAASACI